MNKIGGDVDHVACRAESNVETQVFFLRNAELSSQPVGATSTTTSNTNAYDPRVMTQRDNVGKYAGKFRVLGVGRGVDDGDCGKAAMAACDEAIDAYWRKQNATRPIGEPCRVLEDRDRCPAQTGYRPAPVAAAEPAPASRVEPQLPSLLKKLDDDRLRADAVKGIIQFFENAKARAGGDVANANVKTLLDQVIEPMTKAYTDGKLDDKTRIELIRFLADTRDARAGRAWIKALGSSEDDIEWAALGIGTTMYQEGAPALGEAFAKLEAGTPKGSNAAKNVQGAMIALKNPAWKALLLERVARPLEKPAGASDGAKTKAYQNELFWQTTSAEVLGEMRDATAIKALLKVLLDPAKSDVAPAALFGILRIGREAVPVLLDVLAGKDAELVELSKSKAAGNGGNAKAYVAAAAWALGEVGRVEARDALVRTVKAADNDPNRAALARALTTIAPSADATKAFREAYEKLAPGSTMALSNAAARPALLDAAAGFYDAELVPWLLKQVKGAKGADAEDVRAAGLRAALALMKGPHAPAVSQTVEKLGAGAAKESFRAVSQLVESCDVAVDCYQTKLAEAESAAVGAKSAYMLGELGDANTAGRLVEKVGQIKTEGARAGALAAIDHLVKDGGATVADALDRAKEALAPEEQARVRRTAARLRAR
jgi:hypothetical protein